MRKKNFLKVKMSDSAWTKAWDVYIRLDQITHIHCGTGDEEKDRSKRYCIVYTDQGKFTIEGVSAETLLMFIYDENMKYYPDPY